jgi:hypothetical protein
LAEVYAISFLVMDSTMDSRNPKEVLVLVHSGGEVVATWIWECRC